MASTCTQETAPQGSSQRCGSLASDNLLETRWGAGALVLGRLPLGKKTAPRESNQQCGSLTLLGAVVDVGTGAVGTGAMGSGAMAGTGNHAAFGVFFGLKVWEIDFLFTFFCCHLISSLAG